MQPLTLAEYYKGRDTQYASELTEQIKTNAQETVERANKFLSLFYAANPSAKRRKCTSGWRPTAVNASTPGAAKKSNHMLALAIDIEDDDESLDKWCMSPEGRSAMVKIGLWLESPASTKGWCHLQIVAPRSGKRIFQI